VPFPESPAPDPPFEAPLDPPLDPAFDPPLDPALDPPLDPVLDPPLDPPPVPESPALAPADVLVPELDEQPRARANADESTIHRIGKSLSVADAGRRIAVQADAIEVGTARRPGATEADVAPRVAAAVAAVRVRLTLF
jgi:hypothetical protein